MFERFITTDKLSQLPLSARRVWLYITGQVFENGIEVKPYLDKQGDLVVNINWIGGQKEYRLADLLAHTFKPTRLKFKWWDKINAVFADGDNSNIHPENLVWKFPVGLGSNEYNGFAFIPMYSRYMINKDGVLYDTVSGKILNWHFNKGYYSTTLNPDIGPNSSLKRHRALCLAFTDYPSNLEKLQVNNINGNAGDDRLANLEWVTPSENRKHAILNGLTLVNKPVIAKNLLTGQDVEYFSLINCCEQLNLNEREVSVKLGCADGTYVSGNFVLKYKYPEHAFIGNANKCPVLVRNLKTGEITRHSSIIACSEATGLTKHAIAARIEKPTSNLYNDYMQVKRESDESPWYIPDNYEEELLELSWQKKVMVKDLLTGKIEEFGKQREAAASLGISESTIIPWLNSKEQPVFLSPKENRYIQIKRKSDKSAWRKVADPDKEYHLNSNLRRVVVRNVKTGEIVEYGSATECSKALNISPTTLNWRLKTQGQKLYSDGFQFKYKDCEKPFGEVDSLLVSLIQSAPFD